MQPGCFDSNFRSFYPDIGIFIYCTYAPLSDYSAQPPISHTNLPIGPISSSSNHAVYSSNFIHTFNSLSFKFEISIINSTDYQ